MRNECNIIRDILPLYVEGIASADTVSFVEEHIKGCAECHAELDTMKKPNKLEKITSGIQDDDVTYFKTFKKKWSKRKRIMIGTTSLVTAVVVLLIVALLVGGFIIYKEITYPFKEIRNIQVDMTEEQILKEMPEIAISEEDIALRNFVMSLSEVQNAIKELESTEELQGITIPNEDAEVLLNDWIKDGWTLKELYISGSGLLVYLNYGIGEEKAISYTFSADSDIPTEKIIGIYETNSDDETKCTALYYNAKGEITKSVHRRTWFLWFTDWLDRLG